MSNIGRVTLESEIDRSYRVARECQGCPCGHETVTMVSSFFVLLGVNRVTKGLKIICTDHDSSGNYSVQYFPS